MDLTINRAHARLGERGKMESCPTAVALSCAGFSVKAVWGDMVGVKDGENSTGWYDLPATLQKAIEAYDEGAPFKVGTYRIKGLKRPKK